MQDKLKTVDEILDFAMTNEQQAADFYEELSKKVTDPVVVKALQDFASEEREHKKTLERVKKGKRLLDASAKIMDLKISDYVNSTQPHTDMTFQEVLIFAMKSEKAAYRLYSFLAEAATDRKLRDVFLGLANEEAKHKLRFEIEYDDELNREN